MSQDQSTIVGNLAETYEIPVRGDRWIATLDLPLGKTVVQVHANRLKLIITKLLTNSAKYINPGGRISVVIEIAGNVVTLRVRDNGMGIASDSFPKIEPYWKGPASDGLGIGLALVKSLVELHGGTIAVHSEGPGLGAEFVVHLPSG